MKKIFPILCISGVILAIPLLALMLYLSIQKNKTAPVTDSFYRELQKYDEQVNPSTAVRLLNALERKAFGLEARLSVLKRRRIRAQQSQNQQKAYYESAQKAVQDFPGSDTIALIASDALLMLNAELSDTVRAALISRADSIRELPQAFDLYALAGALSRPEQVLEIPKRSWKSERLSPAMERNILILQVLSGDIHRAAQYLNDVIPTTVSSQTINLAATFFYDYDDPARAGALLSGSTNEENTELQADALYLSGYTESAQNLWSTLTSAANADVRFRSSYNVAATTNSKAEALALLEILNADQRNTDHHIYTTILYSRFLEPQSALEMLNKAYQQSNAPLINLELIKRQQGLVPIDKSIADTWIMLEKYPGNESLYQWAAFYFDYQHAPRELNILIKQASYQGLTGSWIAVYQGILALRTNDLDRAEQYFNNVPEDQAPYQVIANKARILEARRSFNAALNLYEPISQQLNGTTHGAKLYYRMSRCLRALNREEEYRAALIAAVRNDPNLLFARVELQQLGIPISAIISPN
ncbi:MAG: hypothetical protein LBQ77_07450 [Treponema sp.]|nr:hypothetical protein [Treponema sp.]